MIFFKERKQIYVWKHIFSSKILSLNKHFRHLTHISGWTKSKHLICMNYTFYTISANLFLYKQNFSLTYSRNILQPVCSQEFWDFLLKMQRTYSHLLLPGLIFSGMTSLLSKLFIFCTTLVSLFMLQRTAYIKTKEWWHVHHKVLLCLLWCWSEGSQKR